MQVHFISFSPTMPTLKNKKSLKANAQGQCKLDTTDLRPNRAVSANTGLAKVAVQCSAEYPSGQVHLAPPQPSFDPCKKRKVYLNRWQPPQKPYRRAPIWELQRILNKLNS